MIKLDYDEVNEMHLGAQVDVILLRVIELQRLVIHLSTALKTQDQVNKALLDQIKQLRLVNRGIR